MVNRMYKSKLDGSLFEILFKAHFKSLSKRDKIQDIRTDCRIMIPKDGGSQRVIEILISSD